MVTTPQAALSETTAERLVISSSATVHRESCPAVRHYVDGKRPVHHYDYDGDFSVVMSNAVVTADRLKWKYRRCMTCAPDVPEWVSEARFVPKAAGSLNGSDLGRQTRDGIIESITGCYTAERQFVAIIFLDAPPVVVTPDERIYMRVRSSQWQS